jgi:hypothetical protein
MTSLVFFALLVCSFASSLDAQLNELHEEGSRNSFSVRAGTPNVYTVSVGK